MLCNVVLGCDRLQKTQTLFAEQEINSEVYWKNPNIREYVSLVPTSGISGEGIADILLLIVQMTCDPRGALRVISDCHSRKAATEYDRKPGIKWLSCTEK